METVFDTYPLTIDNIPKAGKFDSHVWVDFVELLCLVNPDRSTNKGDVLDRIRTVENDLPKDMHPSNDEDVENDEVSDDFSPAQINDRWSKLGSEWFQHLLYRSRAFTDTYPFTLASTADVLQLKENLTAGNKLYIFLLLCANLRYCMPSKPALTTTFEQLSSEAMKSFFSDMADVHVFGTSESSNRYSGGLHKKIEKLAQDLNEYVVIKNSSFAPTNNGDGGLDIVAWVSMGDQNSHRMMAFGQCACTEEWEVKQYSSSAERWRQLLTLRPGILNVSFIPHCLRRADGEWHRVGDIATVMVDRQRFLFAMAGKEAMLEAKMGYAVVQQAIRQTESIY